MGTDILARVKLGIRRTHDKLDSDLQADINACLQDMKMRGITKLDPSDELVFAAVKLYCRATTAEDPAKGALYFERYEALRDSMSLSSEYTAPIKEVQT